MPASISASVVAFIAVGRMPISQYVLHLVSPTSVCGEDLDVYGDLGTGVEVSHNDRLERLAYRRTNLRESSEYPMKTSTLSCAGLTYHLSFGGPRGLQPKGRHRLRHGLSPDRGPSSRLCAGAARVARRRRRRRRSGRR